jgi:hypothetical protein
MASTFTSRLKLERQASGENAGNWGNLVNYVFNRLDSSVRGYIDVDVAGSANVTLISNNSTTNTDDSSTDDQVHNKVLEFTGALTGDIHVFTDAVEGEYIVFNNTSGSQTLTFATTGHCCKWSCTYSRYKNYCLHYRFKCSRYNAKFRYSKCEFHIGSWSSSSNNR